MDLRALLDDVLDLAEAASTPRGTSGVEEAQACLDLLGALQDAMEAEASARPPEERGATLKDAATTAKSANKFVRRLSTAGYIQKANAKGPARYRVTESGHHALAAPTQPAPDDTTDDAALALLEQLRDAEDRVTSPRRALVPRVALESRVPGLGTLKSPAQKRLRVLVKRGLVQQRSRRSAMRLSLTERGWGIATHRRVLRSVLPTAQRVREVERQIAALDGALAGLETTLGASGHAARRERAIESLRDLGREYVALTAVPAAREELAAEVERQAASLRTVPATGQAALEELAASLGAVRAEVEDLAESVAASASGSVTPAAPGPETPHGAGSPGQMASMLKRIVLPLIRHADSVAFRADHAATVKNEKLLYILREHRDELIEAFHLEPIGELGACVTFDPALHSSRDPLGPADACWVKRRGWKHAGAIVAHAAVTLREPEL